MSSAQDLSPLGSFRKLPLEIRWNIWRFLMPHLREPCYPQSQEESEKPMVSGISKSPQNWLSILCASRELYEEVSEELYRRELCFCICPDLDSFTVKDVPSSTARNFANTPLDRFRNLAIEIQAPDSSRVQRLRIVIPVLEIISLISNMFFEKLKKRPSPPSLVFLHQIDISFVNRTCATWVRAGQFQRSVPEPPRCDIDYFLSLFRLLSKIGSIKVHMPEGLEDGIFVTDPITDSARDITTL
ncbi:hypothetical protein MMC31_001831 [Peltigera leucophlebia]|nr:hypothetical protein [Peltigera leucophlebia]